MQYKDELIELIKAFLAEGSFLYKPADSVDACIDIGRLIHWCEANGIQIENIRHVKNTNEKSKPLRIKDVEERYEISRNTAACIFRADDSPAYRIGTQWFIESTDLVSYLRNKSGKEVREVDIT